MAPPFKSTITVALEIIHCVIRLALVQAAGKCSNSTHKSSIKPSGDRVDRKVVREEPNAKSGRRWWGSEVKKV